MVMCSTECKMCTDIKRKENRVTLTCDQIREFVDGHNTRRLKVAQGLVPGQPAASDMQFMVWDEELEEKASEWADKGVFAHNPDKYVEYKNYNFVPFYLDSVNQFRHYTQMVWSSTNRIGCGVSQIKDNNCTKTLFVCDYGPTGNYFEQKPYNFNQRATNILRCSDGCCSRPYGSNC
ncbi:unnamed protein product [Parnassius apollo]|uniref:(apollo) hypothetical protein n=1 Tax=Parnassius apollo TaxID=110799 RepID=A0A8S3X2T8_PARAO|nr:unnamed protein product [Parnassius apollo]